MADPGGPSDLPQSGDDNEEDLNVADVVTLIVGTLNALALGSLGDHTRAIVRHDDAFYSKKTKQPLSADNAEGMLCDKLSHLMPGTCLWTKHEPESTAKMTIVYRIERDWQEFICIVPSGLRMRSLAGLSSAFLRAGAHGKSIQLETVLDSFPKQDRVKWQFQEESIRCEPFDASALDPPTVSWTSEVVGDFAIRDDVFTVAGDGIEHGLQELKGTYHPKFNKESPPLSIETAFSYVKTYALRFWNHHVLMAETLPAGHIYLGVSEELGPTGIGVNLALPGDRLVYVKEDLNQWLAALEQSVRRWIWGLFPPVDDGLVTFSAWIVEVKDEAALAVVRIEIDVVNRSNGNFPVVATDTIGATGVALNASHYATDESGNLAVTIGPNLPNKTKEAAAKQVKILTVWNVHRERPHRAIRMICGGMDRTFLIRHGLVSDFPDAVADLLGIPGERRIDLAMEYNVPARNPLGEDLLVVVTVDSASRASGNMKAVKLWIRVLNKLFKDIGGQPGHLRRAILLFESPDDGNIAASVARGIGWEVVDCIGPLEKLRSFFAPRNEPIALGSHGESNGIGSLVDWSQKVASADEFLPEASELRARLAADLEAQQHKVWHFLPVQIDGGIFEGIDPGRVLAGGVVRSKVFMITSVVEDYLLRSSPQTNLVTVRAAIRSAGTTVTANQVASVYASQHAETLVLSPEPSTLLEDANLVFDDLATAFSQSHYSSALFVAETNRSETNPGAALEYAFKNHARTKSVVIVIIAGPEYTGEVDHDLRLGPRITLDDAPLFLAFLSAVFPGSRDALEDWFLDVGQVNQDEAGGAGLHVLHLFQPLLAAFSDVYPVISGVVNSICKKVCAGRTSSTLRGLAFSSVFDGDLPATEILPGPIADLVDTLGRAAKYVLVWKRVGPQAYSLVLAHQAVSWAILLHYAGCDLRPPMGCFPEIALFDETWVDFATLLYEVPTEDAYDVLKNVFQSKSNDDRIGLLQLGLLRCGLDPAVEAILSLKQHPALHGESLLSELWKIHRRVAASKLLRYASKLASRNGRRPGRRAEARKLSKRALIVCEDCVVDTRDLFSKKSDDRRVRNAYLALLLEAGLAAEFADELKTAVVYLTENQDNQVGQPLEIQLTRNILARVRSKLEGEGWQTVERKKNKKKRKRRQGRRR